MGQLSSLLVLVPPGFPAAPMEQWKRNKQGGWRLGKWRGGGTLPWAPTWGPMRKESSRSQPKKCKGMSLPCFEPRATPSTNPSLHRMEKHMSSHGCHPPAKNCNKKNQKGVKNPRKIAQKTKQKKNYGWLSFKVTKETNQIVSIRNGDKMLFGAPSRRMGFHSGGILLWKQFFCMASQLPWPKNWTREEPGVLI